MTDRVIKLHPVNVSSCSGLAAETPFRLDSDQFSRLALNAVSPSPEVPAELCKFLLPELDLSNLSDETVEDIFIATYNAREIGLARLYLDELFRRGDRPGKLQYRLGLVELRDGNLADAAVAFQASVELDSRYAEAWYYLAEVKYRLAPYDPPISEILRFIELHDTPISGIQKRLLTKAADFVSENGCQVAAARIYVCLSQYDEGGEIPPLCLARSFLALGQYNNALRIYRSRFWDRNLDSENTVDYAVACIEARILDEASILFDRLYSDEVRSHYVDQQYVRLLCLRKKYEAARQFIISGTTERSSEDTTELLFELDACAGYATSAYDAISSGNLNVSSANWPMLMRVAYHALGIGDLRLAEALADRLCSALGDRAEVISLHLDVLFRLQDWVTAERVLEELPADLIEESLELQLRRFELAALQRRTAEADEYLRAMGDPSCLPPRMIPAVLRHWAQLRRWDDVVDLSRAVLTPMFNYEASAEVILRACRRANRHGDVIREIEEEPAWRETPSLKKLRAVLLEDAAPDAGAIAALLSDPYVSEFGWLKNRVLHKEAALRRGTKRFVKAGTPDKVVFYCTDAAYLCATVMSVYSLLSHNCLAESGAKLCVVLDDEVHGVGSEAFACLSSSFGQSIQVYPASVMVPNASRLSPEYGVFTAGHVLAPAAYFRMFFAKFARNELGLARAIYIDSDTIIRGSIRDLVALEMGVACVAAKSEPYRPEARAASRLNNLNERSYFNSGVMVFDLTSPEFECCINRALHTLDDPGATLVFQDQCALNIGFHGASKDLAERFNFYIGPDMDPFSNSDACVLHFLDRPKPWDVAYDGMGSAFWFRSWAECAGILGGKMAFDLLRRGQV